MIPKNYEEVDVENLPEDFKDRTIMWPGYSPHKISDYPIKGNGTDQESILLQIKTRLFLGETLYMEKK